MAYEIDKNGSVDLGPHLVCVPKTVSPEVQSFLSSPPWEEAPASSEPVPMWFLRDFVDASMLQLNQMALGMFPVDVKEKQVAGVRCHLIRPKEMPKENEGKLLMNLHGGGFVMGSGVMVEAIPIAHLCKIPVLVVDYRLAPEHPFPAAVDDIVAVYRTMLEHHKPTDMGIYGSSAGGFLTAQTVVRLEREGLPLPACLGMFSAGGNLADHGDSAQIFSLMGFYGDRLLPPDHPLSEIKAYVGGADPTNPLVSPIYADLSCFPPTLLMTGTRDALLSATSLFHRALHRAGVAAELFVFEAMPHTHWYMLHLPEAHEALEIMAGFFKKSLGLTKSIY